MLSAFFNAEESLRVHRRPGIETIATVDETVRPFWCIRELEDTGSDETDEIDVAATAATPPPYAMRGGDARENSARLNARKVGGCEFLDSSAPVSRGPAG